MRSLGVIFLADVVGYSKMMASDEIGTLNLIRAFQKETIAPTLAKYGGTMIKSLGETLSNGIEFGLIRKNIDVDFVSRIYYNSILGLTDPEIYAPKNYSLNKTMFDYREYFLRSVVTEKGLKKLDEILINDK